MHRAPCGLTQARRSPPHHAPGPPAPSQAGGMIVACPPLREIARDCENPGDTKHQVLRTIAHDRPRWPPQPCPRPDMAIAASSGVLAGRVEPLPHPSKHSDMNRTARLSTQRDPCLVAEEVRRYRRLNPKIRSRLPVAARPSKRRIDLLTREAEHRHPAQPEPGELSGDEDTHASTQGGDEVSPRLLDRPGPQGERSRACGSPPAAV